MEKITIMNDIILHVRVPAGASKEEVLKALTEEVERKMEFESEDERIRSALLRGFNSMLANQPIGTFYGEPIKDIIAYLEKQKEQKTDAKSERVIKAAKRVLNNWLDGTDCPDVSGDFAELEYAFREYDGEEKQKENKPAEWSEEDLEKETKKWWKEHLHLNPENQLWMDAHQSVSLARHFFELGLNARKEE